MNSNQPFAADSHTHFLMFTGHRIDAPNRPEPRFPVSAEPEITSAIFEKLQEIKNNKWANLLGVAGGASGGDIIFHEQCQKLGIKTGLFLALPTDEYKAKSVVDSGESWIKRFDKLCNSLPVFFLPKDFESVVIQKEELNIWQRNNLWQLEYCLQNGPENIILLALWDGKKGDGPGGTEDMVNQIKNIGREVVIIDINRLIV